MIKKVADTILLGMLLVVNNSCQRMGDDLSYSRDIKPILNEHCLSCHGGIRQLGGFSLLFEEEALAKTESGYPAIIPGNAKGSELITRLREEDPEMRMPQESPALDETEIALLERWIDEGAQWDDHWAYKSLTKSPIPKIDTSWGTNPIDHFVWQKLKEHNLNPSQEALPDVLARRLSFDIIGLPPEGDSVDDFLQTSDDSQYETLVESLLSSPHFGERFAAMWLDLARYADSNGYEKDMGRSIWRYRDWVINSLNSDLPFDQFTIEQLAGDLLENPTKDQLIATAFHRNTMTNTEGGTEDEEFRTMSVMDRVNTTFEVWQATTMSCVQCHAHPYDPFRHEDFYQAMAFFNNTQDADLDSEYPYLLETEKQKEDMEEVVSWIRGLTGETQENRAIDKAVLHDLVFPRLQGDFADNFQNVLISHNGGFNNSSYNSNNQKHKKYYLIFEDVDMDGLEAIKYHYRSKGDDAVIELKLDSINGPLISRAQMLSLANEEVGWQWKSFEIEQRYAGNHDLVFDFINTTGDFRDGVVDLKEAELVYKNVELTPKMRSYQDSLLSLYRQGIKTPIMKERGQALKRKTHLFERGNYLVWGPEMQPGVPSILTKKKDNMTSRLDLARWLVSDDNPLTSRVMVNRIWEQIFGRGIVETLEDFGTQGFPPTHEELLNHLAYQFSHDWNWSLKRLVKEIVMSDTYRQSSKVDDHQLALDPANIWYGRGSRVRLSAEQIRDQALAVSGLLNREIGGESVMPPQPDGVWQIVYSSARWEADKEEDKYRRGLYTYWKRTTPYPSMTAFDTPSREFCVSRRINTNTPLQALVTLNDPAFLKAAEMLGIWMKQKGGGNVNAAIEAGYQKALLKKPDKETLGILRNLYDEANVPTAKLISYQEKEEEPLQAITVVANAILNLDAFLNKS